MRKRRIAATGLAGTLLAISAILPGDPAYAATCTTSSHCYGEVEWTSGNQVFGISETLNVSCLGPMGAPTSSNFVTEEEWLTTAENASGNYWVELGMAYGSPQGSTRYFFWADQRPNGGGYHEHDLSIAANLHQNYVDEISYAGGNSWQVRRDGSLLGTSTRNPGPSYSANTGEELTAGTGAAAATMSALMRQTSSGGGWYAYWPGAATRTDAPPYGGWISQEWSADFYSNCAFSMADPGPTFAPFTASEARQAIARISAGLSAANGVAAPQSTQYVQTRRQRAERLTSRAKVDSDQPVYLVTMRGNFVGHAAKVPNGKARPQGTVLTATIDPATGRITDWGITGSAPDLSSLGVVRHIG
jgi:hypothetical protein